MPADPYCAPLAPADIYRKKQVTRERKQMAEEKARLEIMAQKVRCTPKHSKSRRDSSTDTDQFAFLLLLPSQMSAKKLARKKRRMGITKKVSHA